MEADNERDEELMDDEAPENGDPASCLIAFKNLVIKTLEENDLA
jgi:hypothetical protein